MDTTTAERIRAWSCAPFDLETQNAVNQMTEEEKANAFYTRLSFGTGGLRGLMGIGTNRMNRYTVSIASEGLARYLKKAFSNEKLCVFIGYDCRHHSRAFAEVAARVLAGHGIKVFISDTLVTTPFTSFAVRSLGCHAGIMVTASHNPKEYNGYKVYWQDGAQILSPHDREIEKAIDQVTSPDQVKLAPIDSPFIEWTGDALKEAYNLEICKLQLLKEKSHQHGAELKVVFSNLHGTGIVFIPELMRKWGFTNFETVAEQEKPDGDFPTVHFPNPEEAASLDQGIKTLERLHGDLLIATDPDGDRMRVAVRSGEKIELLNGNQIACLLLYHILSNSKTLPANSVVVKTIVTTDLFRKIAAHFNIECVDVLTGFKYIGELIHRYEDGSKTFIFGGEESYGTLFGTCVRDKDGVLASLLIAEAALAAHLEGKTLMDRMEELYQTFGRHTEGIRSINYPETKEGREKMGRVMKLLRNLPPNSIQGLQVLEVEDYLQQKQSTLPLADMLLFRLESGAKLIIRPSGTEPKIKLYGEVVGTSEECFALLNALEL